ncbi:hypothetical protein [Chitinivorax sp. B]|uniref:DUF7660 family protein n=1 Tax=Chitinivorax sp. B TaxID=2502235 RepID=UPI0020176FF5|nr:hypothetical protein [Chitinivorax sp. B]
MDAAMDLHEQLQLVTDVTTFLAFVRALQQDRVMAGQHTACDWQNHTIEDFLEAALRWASTTNMGASQGLSEASPWKRFAVFLYCGKIYE